MKYFLTQDLYQEMFIIGGSSPFFHTQNYSGPVLEFDENVDYVSILDILYASVKKLYNDNTLCYGDEFIIRGFSPRHLGKHLLPEYYISLLNPKPNNTSGNWEYTFAKIHKSCLYISKKYYSNFVNPDGSYSIKNSDGEIISISLSDIASSTDKKYFDAFMPPDKNMFAAEEVKYIIPVNLLTRN